MDREELIKQLGFACTYCDGSGAMQISEDEIEQCQYCYEIKPNIADFILSYTSQLREENERLKALVDSLADHLRYVLPLAVGYANVNNHAINVELVVNAKEELAKIAEFKEGK